MGERTRIGWCDHTFNPWWGCQEVSPACDHCYARTWARRTGHDDLWGPGSRRRFFGDAHWREPIKWAARARAAGERRRVFCSSMADVFDNAEGLDEQRARLFELIDRTGDDLDWLLLTKRIVNAKRMLPADWLQKPRPYVWLGITTSNQAEVDRDVPRLIETPAVIRFLSVEPLLSPIDFHGRWVEHPNPAFHENWLERIDWMIVGGESGHHARPMHVDWVRLLRDQCEALGVAFFFKQWGEWISADQLPADHEITSKPTATWIESDGAWQFDTGTDVIQDGQHVRLGKDTNGNELDGQRHENHPMGRGRWVRQADSA